MNRLFRSRNLLLMLFAPCLLILAGCSKSEDSSAAAKPLTPAELQQRQAIYKKTNDVRKKDLQ